MADKEKMKCAHCSKIFEVVSSAVRAKRAIGQSNFYCCRACYLVRPQRLKQEVFRQFSVSRKKSGF